jgi:hypothetical protein
MQEKEKKFLEISMGPVGEYKNSIFMDPLTFMRQEPTKIFEEDLPESAKFGLGFLPALLLALSIVRPQCNT